MRDVRGKLESGEQSQHLLILVDRSNATKPVLDDRSLDIPKHTQDKLVNAV
jgi:hypothetical protein